ncbi:MAG: phage integrase N-terminal SAM-like domain-containing protein [Betaproteobacteria bacterium]|nr:phage integrase N-terminal SAM-like domain-containing protein [Betaproteobacteria bacterium]
MSAPETLRGEKPRLLRQVHEAIRRLHYSRRTEEAYVHWIKRFVVWSGRRHPAALGEREVSAFLCHLASELDVAAATRNQALAALLFLCKQVPGRDMPRPRIHGRFAYLRQNPGVNTTSRVNNSSRPSNIAMVQIQIWNPFRDA